MSCNNNNNCNVHCQNGAEASENRMTDAALIAAVRSGDNAAAGSLLEQYKPLLKKSVMPFARTYPNEQDDFSQEAMLCLYKAAMTYDAGKASVTFGVYAKTCVRNGLISYQRRLKKQVDFDLPGDDFEENDGSDADNVTDVIIRNETLQTLLRNIEALPEKEKAVMHGVMRGRATKDIAANLGLTVRAVESILYRVRRDLHAKQK